MPLDPKQLFIVSAISRESIHEELRDYFENATGDGSTLSYGDWLTDEFCTKFATELGNLDNPDRNTNDDEYQAFLYDMLKELGIELDLD